MGSEPTIAHLDRNGLVLNSTGADRHWEEDLAILSTNLNQEPSLEGDL